MYRWRNLWITVAGFLTGRCYSCRPQFEFEQVRALCADMQYNEFFVRISCTQVHTCRYDLLLLSMSRIVSCVNVFDGQQLWALQKQLNQSSCHLWAYSRGPKEPCIRLLAHVKWSKIIWMLRKLAKVCRNFANLQRLPCNNMLMPKQYDKQWVRYCILNS